ncbi:MAG: molybdopterin-synthase adenylyltransferase MoeB [Thalassolituus sp.]|jgi:adenylyltransferase/sulfurtransferase|uniref:Sulfur carrier protein adenylyltransferase ThiF n=1 Tax=hydrothermal vent metagenome TaxID=652676 RepID=A0A160T980_9ZZZZ|nr:molybdopterin-synthase adenylyltransferase MoeB [Thalassolituus oleivorans]APR67932.1 molybdopterin-synthase adenylyltransferase MoeB [Thalassolituus oleivorans]PCI49924.1 MAG: molybdopterin-synthase adenylyltransferase MoeB [Oceanospirillales bacterium]PHQ85954.1 MAG: molybdopterin-synthase adenylyltransferase MoeB [Thalassobium sp.]
MNDDQLLRYSRHLLLSDIDVDGQQALLDAHVMIIGLGGLGSPVALYLAAAGVGKLSLVDDDHVEISNLQRQIAHQQAAVGRSKVESAATSCQQLNADVVVEVYPFRATNEWLNYHLSGVSLVVDCSDNAAVRYAINARCVAHAIPWVSGAAIGFSGQVAVFDPRDSLSPCYGCLYPNLNDQQLSCAEAGVLSPLVGVIGSMQALEALRLISPFGSPQAGWLATYDAKAGQWQRWQLSKRSNCPHCNPV